MDLVKTENKKEVSNIRVEWKGENDFRSVNEAGAITKMSKNESFGDSPMIMLLHATAGCTGIDMMMILKKMRSLPDEMWIEVEAEKKKDGEANVWGKIHLHYHFKGDLDKLKLEKAISLSLDKYCSVSKMLEKTAEISSEYTLY